MPVMRRTTTVIPVPRRAARYTLPRTKKAPRMPPNQIHQGSWPLLDWVLDFAVLALVFVVPVPDFLPAMARPMQIRANTMTPTTRMAPTIRRRLSGVWAAWK